MIKDFDTLMITSGPVPAFVPTPACRRRSAVAHPDFAGALGIGAAPADELASRSGLSNGNGVDVDACGRTTAPFVFAVDDVANRFEPALGRHIRPEHWQNAQNHAMAVARNMIGADAPLSEVPWFWSG